MVRLMTRRRLQAIPAPVVFRAPRRLFTQVLVLGQEFQQPRDIGNGRMAQYEPLLQRSRSGMENTDDPTRRTTAQGISAMTAYRKARTTRKGFEAFSHLVRVIPVELDKSIEEKNVDLIEARNIYSAKGKNSQTPGNYWTLMAAEERLTLARRMRNLIPIQGFLIA